MAIQSPEQSEGSKSASVTAGNDLEAIQDVPEDATGPRIEKLADAKEAPEPDASSNESSQSQDHRTALDRLKHFATWAPKNCRYDPNEPPKFSLSLNLLFAVVSFRLCTKRQVHEWGVKVNHHSGRHDHSCEFVLRAANPVPDCKYLRY